MLMSPDQPRMRRVLSLVIFASLGCLDFSRTGVVQPDDGALHARCEAAVPEGPELSQPVALQLHTHALSNHGSSSRPASMQFDSYQAHRLGMGGVVWSEHLLSYDQRDPVTIWPARGSIDPDSLHIVGLFGDASRLGAMRSGAGVVGARIEGSELIVTATGGTLSRPTRLQYFTQHRWFDGVHRWPESLRFNRSLTSGAKVDVDYRLCGDGAGPLHVVIRLSWHVDATGNEVQHAVHYVLRANGGAETQVIEAPGVLRVERLISSSGRVELDVLSDASMLPDGDDNTIVDISWYVESQDETTRCAAVERILLRSDAPEMERNWAESRRLSTRYREHYGLQQYVGFEGWVVNPPLAVAGFADGGRAGAHMNVLFQDEAPPVLAPYLDLGGRELVRAVHSDCGVATINHPFGYELMRGGDSTSRLALRSRVFEFLMAQRAFGADLMEVGLPARGDGLDVHLQLWDRLNAAGIRLCGVGTSDTHGWRWDNPATATWTENRNPYVTWVWMRAADQRALASALRRCRAFFGDPFQFTGTIDLEVLPGNARMGATIRATADSTQLRPLVTGLGQHQVWLIQALMTSANAVEYIRQTMLVDPTAPVWLSTSRASFVRLEVRASDGRAVAFSNPIWLTR